MSRIENIKEILLGKRDGLAYLIDPRIDNGRIIAQVISMSDLEDREIIIDKDITVNLLRAYTSHEKKYTKEYEVVLHFPLGIEDNENCVGGIALVKETNDRYFIRNGKLAFKRK